MKNSIMHTNRGITLLETLITVAILTIIVISVTTFIVQSYRADLFANEQVEAIRNAQRGVDVMVKEIRESSPAENGAYPVETATDQTVIFYSDTDADELIERIRYTLDGTNLIRGVTKPSGWPATYNNPEMATTRPTRSITRCPRRWPSKISGSSASTFRLTWIQTARRTALS